MTVSRVESLQKKEEIQFELYEPFMNVENFKLDEQK